MVLTEASYTIGAVVLTEAAHELDDVEVEGFNEVVFLEEVQTDVE